MKIKTKKKKQNHTKPLLVTNIIVFVLGAAAVLYLYVFRNNSTPAEVVKTDTDLLTAHAWEKAEAPTVIWTFRPDGTGELTTNKSNYYDFTWSFSSSTNNYLELDSLEIKTAWLYELEDKFSYEFVNENLVVKSLSDGTESTFLPLGTQSELEEEPESEAPAAEEVSML